MNCVIVTGASRGIGRHLCDELAGDWEVVGLARTKPDAFPHRFILADVTDPDQVRNGIKGLGLKRVYGLINCAGIASMNLFLTTPMDTARGILTTNAFGTMNVCAAVLPAMIRNRGGRIINFSSIAVGIGLEGESVYVASKAAVEAFGRVLAKEVGGYGITVNTVSPNPVDTDLIAGVDEAKIDSLVQRQAIKRKASFHDILHVVRFYLSEESSLITGQNLVLGGY